MLSIKSIKDTQGDAVRVAVHGPAGAGKTRLIASLARPVTDAPPAVKDESRILIVSAEAGLLSLPSDFGAQVVELSRHADRLGIIREIYQALRGSASPWDAVCVDSITEVANMALASAKAAARDGRAAYGEMQDEMMAIYRGLRSLGVITYVSAQSVCSEGTHTPLMPGSKLGSALTYEVDELFFLRPTDDGGRELVTSPTPTVEAKDRSGKLEPAEPACLSSIIRKIRGAQ